MSYQEENIRFSPIKLYKQCAHHVPLPQIFSGENILPLFWEKHTLSQRARISQGQNEQQNVLSHENN